MAVITFHSPIMDKEKTARAEAGDGQTLLQVAQDHNIPIPSDCENGECGSCCVKVTSLAGPHVPGAPLTEKEKDRLMELSLVTAEEIRSAECSQVPPAYRMACQYVIGEGPIRVEFSGEAGTGID